MTLKDLVKDTRVRFKFYRTGELWYEVYKPHDDPIDWKPAGFFEFPVPISDCGDAAFLDDDKAILFMRYIRKHMKVIDDARNEQSN